MSRNAPKLGIIAGGGHLPARLIEACRQSEREFFVLAIDGAADMEPIEPVPHARVRLGALGDALNYLKSAGVQEIVMAGGVKRPSMLSLMPDAVGAKLIAKAGMKVFSGDDALLSAIVKTLEEEGFTVVGANHVLGNLVASEGTITKLKPDAQALEDIELAVKVAKAVGALDVGQAVIVESGNILGVEAAEGTDALIARCVELQREKKRAVLVKARKPSQEERVDLPTVGPQTIHRLYEAGMLGVAYEAGGTILLDAQEVARLADQYKLFVCGVHAP